MRRARSKSSTRSESQGISRSIPADGERSDTVRSMSARISVYCIASLLSLFPHCRWLESPCPGELPRIHQGFESICPVRCTANPNRQCYPGGTEAIPDADELPQQQTDYPREGS